MPSRRARTAPEHARRRSPPRGGVVRLRGRCCGERWRRRVRWQRGDAVHRSWASPLLGKEPRPRPRERSRSARGPRVRTRWDALSDLGAAVVLGIVQGLTEFLPVSSTAHLILVSDLLKLDPERFGLSFDVALHLGTALAVLLYFAGTWIDLVLGLFRGRWRMPALIVLGTAPAAIAGVLFQSVIEREMRGPLVIAAGLVVGSVVFVVAEARARQRRLMNEVGIVDVLVIGIAQAIALIPGISRSGITISAGLVRELRREDATRFAFLLATPVILGAGAKTLLDARKAAELLAAPDVLAVGFVLSFLSGLAAVAFMVRFLRGHSLNWFVAYRLVLAVLIVVGVIAGIL
ncbi:MAG: undecaprenyl-diphosphate phosphatase [Chloroflexi bacterium]|nr:MAG: undecaprenyl-diphosphate phosphatase [Chloroflexota bacterium]